MGQNLFLLLCFVELLFLIWTLVTRCRHGKEKGAVRIAELLVFSLFLLAGVLSGILRYGLLLAVLLIKAVLGVITLIRPKEKPFGTGRQIGIFVREVLLFAFALLPAFLFPQYKEPAVTGGYEVLTAEYTWTDEARRETFTDTGENRRITVKVWYPDTDGERFPLVLFSHGAFGVIDSNFSACTQLASNGYVVVSIGHSYHAAYVEETSGRIIPGSSEFVQQVYGINRGDYTEEEIYELSKEWMELRTADENFVLDTLLAKAAAGEETPFSLIDSGRIGLFGHSMGGASAAELGRMRNDIDAVIVLEGTLLGEYEGFENGRVLVDQAPYPVPILDVYSRDIYEGTKFGSGLEYVNFHTGSRAEDYHVVVFENAGHMNFTDLPLVSPFLAKMLGGGGVETVGKTDALQCIENVNEMVLIFFDSYLKEKGELKLPDAY